MTRPAAARPGGALLALLGTAAATAGARRALDRRPPGGPTRWARTNHRGEAVTLLAGPAYAVGAVSGAALLAPVAPRVRLAAALATSVAGAAGLHDDLSGDSSSKGLRGHLGALARGQVTTGSLKILALAAGGTAAAALAGGPRGRRPGLVGTLVGGAAVAGSANLLNLLDLRPGRALKTTLLAAPATGALGAVAAGAAAALLPEDLAERAMLGDAGANAAGALLGVAAVSRLGTGGRLALLAGLTALTLASERVSFTAVIERTPGLRELDQLGRRPR